MGTKKIRDKENDRNNDICSYGHGPEETVLYNYWIDKNRIRIRNAFSHYYPWRSTYKLLNRL